MDVSTTRHSGTARITVTGDLDTETSPRLEQELHQLSVAGVDDVVIDLAGVSFLSSAGLSVLISAKRDLARFRIERGNRLVDRLVDLTGLEMLYGTERSDQVPDRSNGDGSAAGSAA